MCHGSRDFPTVIFKDKDARAYLLDVTEGKRISVVASKIESHSQEP